MSEIVVKSLDDLRKGRGGSNLEAIKKQLKGLPSGQALVVTATSAKEMANETRRFRAAGKELGITITSSRQTEDNLVRAFSILKKKEEEE